MVVLKRIISPLDRWYVSVYYTKREILNSGSYIVKQCYFIRVQGNTQLDVKVIYYLLPKYRDDEWFLMGNA